MPSGPVCGTCPCESGGVEIESEIVRFECRQRLGLPPPVGPTCKPRLIAATSAGWVDQTDPDPGGDGGAALEVTGGAAVAPPCKAAAASKAANTSRGAPRNETTSILPRRKLHYDLCLQCAIDAGSTGRTSESNNGATQVNSASLHAIAAAGWGRQLAAGQAEKWQAVVFSRRSACKSPELRATSSCVTQRTLRS